MTVRRPSPTNGSWSDGPGVELLVAGLLGALLCLAVPVYLIGQLAAVLHTGHGTALHLSDALRTAAAWPRHLRSPGRAFPPAVRPDLPSTAVLDGCALLVLAALTAVLCGLVRLWPGRRGRAGFANRTELRALSGRTHRHRAHPDSAGTARRGARGWRGRGAAAGLYLGREVRSRRPLYGATEDSYLYLGPPRSGKGVHLIIPQTLAAPGPALVTATRPDTLRHTLALRRARGPVAVFDPQGLAGDHPRLRWAPQRGCADPLLAIARARALAAGAQPTALGSGSAEMMFWQQMTEAVLRCYLHAAALADLTMRDVLGWVARPADPAPQRILRTHPGAAPGWAEELTAQAAADPRQRDSVWAGVRRSVDCLADPRVLDSCSPPPGEAFDSETFLRQRGTLYLLGTTGAQLTVAPLITALVDDLIDAARRLAATAPHGRLDPPLTVLLDEAANIAPIPSLPNLLADGGGSGITTICVLQSLAQARARWGTAGADAMWDSATTKVVLGGLAHADDLSRISRLAGDIDEDTSTRTRGPAGPSTSIAARRTPALPVEQLRCLPPGHAIVLSRRTPPIHAVMTPWWRGPHATAVHTALSATAAHRLSHDGAGDSFGRPG